MNDISQLKQIPLFSELDENELGSVRQLMQARHYAPGQVVIREGEPGDFFHIITEGDVEFSTLDAGGRELVLDDAGPGGFFGELSMLTGEPRAVRVRARDRVSTLALDRKNFHEFLLKHPAAAIDILTGIARRLHRTDTLLRRSVSPNVNDVIEDRLTLGQRIADNVATAMGSWPFIIIQSVLLGTWVVINALAWKYRWDPYPFILMNLALSFQAAYAAPIIMMSQNRQSMKDRLAAEVDHDTNVKAEVKVGLIISRLDDLERSMHYLHDEQRTLLKQLNGNTATQPASPQRT